MIKLVKLFIHLLLLLIWKIYCLRYVILSMIIEVNHLSTQLLKE